MMIIYNYLSINVSSIFLWIEPGFSIEKTEASISILVVKVLDLCRNMRNNSRKIQLNSRSIAIRNVL